MKCGVDLPTPTTPEALPGSAEQPDQPLREPSDVPRSGCHRAQTSCQVVNSEDLSSRATRFRARSWRRPYLHHPRWGPTPLTYIGSWTLTFMGSGTLSFGAAH